MDNNENKKPEKPLKNVAVLSGIAIQMGVTIYLFVILIFQILNQERNEILNLYSNNYLSKVKNTILIQLK